MNLAQERPKATASSVQSRGRPRRRVFESEEKMEELKALLAANKAYHLIAAIFQCDHSSVIYQARKLGYGKGAHPMGGPINPLTQEEKAKLLGRKLAERYKYHCQRCDILFKYGGRGNGQYCDDCLDELGIL